MWQMFRQQPVALLAASFGLVMAANACAFAIIGGLNWATAPDAAAQQTALSLLLPALLCGAGSLTTSVMGMMLLMRSRSRGK
mgnify:CR=1 FL=1